MARRRIPRRVWFALWLLFGAVTVYCLYGAVHERLLIPGRYSGHDTIYSGSAAWAVFAAVLSYWLVTWMYVCVGPNDSDSRRSVVGAGLVVLGVVLLALAEYLRSTLGA